MRGRRSWRAQTNSSRLCAKCARSLFAATVQTSGRFSGATSARKFITFIFCTNEENEFYRICSPGSARPGPRAALATRPLSALPGPAQRGERVSVKGSSSRATRARQLGREGEERLPLLGPNLAYESHLCASTNGFPETCLDQWPAGRPNRAKRQFSQSNGREGGGGGN